MAVTGPPSSSRFHFFCSSSLPFLAFSLGFSLAFLFVSFYLKKYKRPKEEEEEQLRRPAENSIISFVTPPSSLSSIHQHQDLPKWAPALSPPPPFHDDQRSSGGEGEQEKEEKKRKKRARKKKQDSRAGSVDGGEDAVWGEKDPTAGTGEVAAGKDGADCIYPFSSFSSATQRRIKHQYDQLVKSNQAKALTMAQVGQFVNCLIEARKELQHKSEIVQRRFTIAKALLFKADRSSFDRLCQQIYKLEAEHKRLEDDTIVYNRLQEQLKLSPAYKKMLEIGSCMESKAGSDPGGENIDSEFADTSFEELLAQEKKDSFWQRNGKLRSCTS